MSFVLKPSSTILVFFILELLLYHIIICKDSSGETGYILYCPCMGRFGNQADHFLGALAFSHGLKRTLVLPPWVEYRTGQPKSVILFSSHINDIVQVPFDTHFKVEALQAYHNVMTMENFMKNIAPSIWPPGNRTVFCYTSRGDRNDCSAKEGNPFGPFWDTYQIDFDHSEFYSPLHYDIHHQDMGTLWNRRYPLHKFPVLAFTGAPASFPVQKDNLHLQSFLVWSNNVLNKAHSFIKGVLTPGPFVGIHLRNGIDWTRACEHIEHSPLLFSAPQCLGYNREHGNLTSEICFPSKEQVLKQLKRVVKATKARSVFVASDNDHMIADINQHLKILKVQAFKYEPENVHVDLAILGLSNIFLGNCVSSYSAFVKRHRDVMGLPSSFWAFPSTTEKRHHEEL